MKRTVYISSGSGSSDIPIYLLSRILIQILLFFLQNIEIPFYCFKVGKFIIKKKNFEVFFAVPITQSLMSLF